MDKFSPIDELDKQYFNVLDNLRASGEINMFGAPQWLERNHGLPSVVAKAIFTKWSDTFSERVMSGEVQL